MDSSLNPLAQQEALSAIETTAVRTAGTEHHVRLQHKAALRQALLLTAQLVRPDRPTKADSLALRTSTQNTSAAESFL